MKRQEMGNYIGKHILVGLTYVDSNGNVLSQKQFHGNISRIELERGIFIEIAESGAEFAVPPDFSVIQVAQPGEYKLKETGEVVVNPDLIAIWRIEKP